MKTLLSLLLCTAAAATVLAAPAPKPQIRPGRDLIDTALTVHEFDTFLMMVRDADLTFYLKRRGPYTIYAPTNDAFKKMPSGWMEHILGNKPRLRQFILHHVVRGYLTAERTIKARRLTALDHSRLIVGSRNGHGTLGGAQFTVENVLTSNGVLHGIDTVLMPR